MKNRDLQDRSIGTGSRRILSRRKFLQTTMISAAAMPLSMSAASAAHSNNSTTKDSRLFWGDLHTHTNLSDGNGNPEDNFEIARSHLDFWTMADHAYDKVVFDRDFRKTHGRPRILNDSWEFVQQLCREYEKPGKFIPFLGYEWTNFQYGHHNVYYLQYDQPIRMPSTLPKLYASGKLVSVISAGNRTFINAGRQITCFLKLLVCLIKVS